MDDPVESPSSWDPFPASSGDSLGEQQEIKTVKFRMSPPVALEYQVQGCVAGSEGQPYRTLNHQSGKSHLDEMTLHMRGAHPGVTPSPGAPGRSHNIPGT